MKICVIGAGAIGGLLAAKLARAGEDVSVIARGAHLAAIASNGLTLIEEGVETVAKVKASDRIADFGEQDLIILCVKAHQVATVVGDLPAMMGARTAVLTAQNGIPWWYFFKQAGHTRAGGWRASTPAASSPIICPSTACWPAWFTRRRGSSGPASSVISKGSVLRSAKSTDR